MIFSNVNKAHQLAKYWTSSGGETKSWHLSAWLARTLIVLSSLILEIGIDKFCAQPINHFAIDHFSLITNQNSTFLSFSLIEYARYCLWSRSRIIVAEFCWRFASKKVSWTLRPKKAQHAWNWKSLTDFHFNSTKIPQQSTWIIVTSDQCQIPTHCRSITIYWNGNFFLLTIKFAILTSNLLEHD